MTIDKERISLAINKLEDKIQEQVDGILKSIEDGSLERTTLLLDNKIENISRYQRAIDILKKEIQ